LPDPARVLAGRKGALKSWANTVDRTARTAPARRASPLGLAYWLDRLGPEFDGATTEQKVAAADAAYRAHQADLAWRAAKARSAKAHARRTGPPEAA
jgi:hypothetical protein